MQNNKRLNRLFAVIGFITAWFAVIFQYYLLIKNNDSSFLTKTIQFASYFTILTNTLVAIYYTAVLVGDTTKNHWLLLSTTATAITVYITIVGLVYNLVLRFTWNPQGLQKLVDELLHTFNPLFFIIFWWLFIPKQNLKWQHALAWLIYPLIYFIYILLRGAIAGVYPYPFINVTEHGYGKVLLNSVAILLVFVFFSLLFIAIGRLKNKESIR